MANLELHKALTEAIEKLLAGLRDRLVEEVSSLTAVGDMAHLHGSALNILTASGQVEILQKLLDATEPYCARAVLLVVKGDRLTGWHGRGIAADTLHSASFSSEGPSGWKQAAVGKVQPEAVSGPLAESLAAAFGSSAHAYLLPMDVKERAVAMLYVDSGDSTAVPNVFALDLLVRLAGLHLETSVARPRTHAADAAAAMAASSAPAAAGEPLVARAAAAAQSTPVEASQIESAAAGALTASAPVHDAEQTVLQAGVGAYTAVPAEPRPDDAVPAITPEVVRQPPAPPAPAVPVARPLSGPDLTGVPPADEDAHRKAFRMAKVLVDELVLYNREKIEQGRAKRDIYGMIRDEVDKSRAAYEKKWSNTPAGKVDYFHQLFLARVANQDPTLLGTEYPGPLV